MEKPKAEQDAQPANVREVVSKDSSQAELSKATIAELAALTSAVQAIHKQTMEYGKQANEALESIRTLATIATENAALVEGLKSKAEQTAQAAAATTEKSKTTIDGQLAAAREATSVINQQAEAAKSTIAELTALSTNLQTANNQTKDTATQATAALESVRTLANTATEIVGRSEALKTQIEQAAQVAATRSEHIEEGRKYVDAKRAEIDVISNNAQQSASSAEAQHVASKATLDNINALYTAAQTVKAGAEGNAEACLAARTAAEAHAVITKRLAEVAVTTETKIAQYESQLKEMQEASDKQRKIVDDLLFGATNAGLASAFDKRSQTFKRPEMIWQRIFMGSLAGLLMLAVWQAIAYGSLGQAADWQQMMRLWLFKLPVLIPLIWLAIHAARQASFAKRMEEEYAFKATISTSFEGYRREMAEVGKGLALESPLARLCNDTLVTISTPPGQIYDKHRMDPTPGTAVAEVVRPIVDGVSKALAAKLPDLKG